MRALYIIGSRWAMAAITLAMGSVYVAMTFGESPYTRFTDFIFHSPLGLALYCGLVISLVAMSVLAVVRRIRPIAPSVDAVRSMDAHVHFTDPQGPDSLEGIAQWLATSGFRPRIVPQGLLARRGALSVLPGTVLRAGVALVMVALLMGAHMRQEQQAIVAGGGESVVLFDREVRAVSISSDISSEYLQVGKADFVLQGLSALMLEGHAEFRVTGWYPVSHGGLYWRIVHMGYVQPVEHGGVTEFLELDLLPPGHVAVASPLPGAGVYEFRLAPERQIKKGLITGDVYNLISPRYELSPRGRKDGMIMARATEAARIGVDNVQLGPAGLYVTLLAARDPSLPFLRAGLLVLALALLMMIARIFWYERVFVAVMHEGSPLLGYSEEFYKKWGIYKFRRWTSGGNAP